MRAKPIAIKCSEKHIASWVADIFQVPRCDDLGVVLEGIVDSSSSSHAVTIAKMACSVPYAWNVDVAAKVMSGELRDNDLIAELFSLQLGDGLIARDSERSGRESLWLLYVHRGEDPLLGIPYRGLVNHFEFSRGCYDRVVAVQLHTCAERSGR